MIFYLCRIPKEVPIMGKQNPFPVTEDNFFQCWEYVDKRRRAARVKSVISKIGGFVVNLVFLLLLVLIACGLIHDRIGGTFGAFVETLFFFPQWQQVTALLLKPDATLWADIGTLLLADYVVSAAVFALLAALVWLLYHPRKEKLPTGTYEENTALLLKKAQEGRDCCYKTHLNPSIVASVLTVFFSFGMFFAYAIYLQDAAAITRLLTIFPTEDPQTNSLLYVLVLYKVCDVVCSVLLFITRPLYRYDFPYELVVQAQRGTIYAREQDGGLSPEELEAKYKSLAVQIREDALEMEKIAAYGKAKEMFLEAAVLSDVPAMENYARLCLLSRMNDSARYWLKKCVSTEEASRDAKRMLLRLRLGLRHNVEYRKPEEAPPTVGAKIKNVLLAVITVIWKVFILALLIACILLCITLFKASTDPSAYDALPTSLAELMADVKSMVNTEMSVSYEEVSPFETPTMTLTEEGTRWENGCVAYDEKGAPVIFCYGKDIGGDLKVPCEFGTNGQVTSASLYTGNTSNMKWITPQVSYLADTQTAVVSGEYLMSLEPGEYFIILNNTNYLPILITEETTFNSTQRGIAACGGENNWIINDLQDPQDITLSFYNLGDNPIRSLTELSPLTMSQNPAEFAVDPAFYEISPDGYSVTIKQEYWEQQEAGAYVGFQVRLTNGDKVDTGYTYVGTVDGDFTGLLEITGSETYSNSKGGDFTVQYEFGLPGMIMNLHVHSDSQSDIINEDSLMDMASNYIDFDNFTITIPADELKPYLTVNEYFYIGIGYSTGHGQNAYTTFAVKVTW